MNREIIFHDARCLRMRSSRATCERCVISCPLQAITIQEGPVIDHDRCVGCLQCTVSCPTGALLPKDTSLFSLLTPLKGISAPVLGCLRKGVDGHLRFPCLGGLPEEAILALMLFSPLLQLNLTGCHECPSGFILAELKERIKRCREALTLEEEGGITLATERSKLKLTEVSYNRRDFFRTYRSILLRGAAEIDRGIRTSVMPAASVAKGPPERRQLLNRATASLPEGRKAPILARYYFELSLGETCDLCFLCGGACPTGALEASYGNPPALLFRGALCVGCDLCREVCPKEALTLSACREWDRVNTCRPLVPE
ncbi:MAG: 4Fe-4S binding protein [Smithellaceae bacterium]|nr:4Fe-4S binding protein [Smithellaceae bacterium]